LDLLAVTMGGRIAEEMFTNDVSNGAAGDIRQATSLARRMVCEWGMSSLGMISFTESNDYVFLGRDMGRAREHSEATAQLIDAEVKRIIDQAYERAKKILEDHRTDVEKIAKALLEYETLDASHVKEIIEFGELRNPPIQEVAPPPLPPPPSGIASEPPETIKPELPPGGLGSPAPA
jgi:cell division protease FtsH